jgi:hypothetical protein
MLLVPDECSAAPWSGLDMVKLTLAGQLQAATRSIIADDSVCRG